MEGESIWDSLKKRIKECETKWEVKIRKTRLGEHSWWDTDYKGKKRNVYKAYKRKEDKERRSIYD